MKAEFDKEIDALLRRSARAAGRVAPPPRDSAPATHLDADELSAFAENALPTAARLSAVSHLADCDECRAAVVSLSRAAGTAGELERRAAAPASVDPSEALPSRGRLAALFSPRVLRFVAPALALCLVGAVAFVLLRARRDPGSVAQRSAERAPIRPGITGGAGADTGAGADAAANVNAEATANMNANLAPQPEPSDQRPAGPERPAPSTTTTHDHDAPDGSIDRVSEVAREPRAEATPAEAEAPPPPRPVVAAAPPAASTSEVRDAAKEKKEDDGRAADEAAPVEGANQERRANQLGNLEAQQTPDGARSRSVNNNYSLGRSVPASPRREPERSARSTGPRARGEAGGGATREDAAPAAETRSVAGRRFRREGNAWVDVNYRPSMSMTGVRRGTEGFRALVADLPEIGRIAEQLSGEVITVVRGQAYRIR